MIPYRVKYRFFSGTDQRERDADADREVVRADARARYFNLEQRAFHSITQLPAAEINPQAERSNSSVIK